MSPRLTVHLAARSTLSLWQVPSPSDPPPSETSPGQTGEFPRTRDQNELENYYESDVNHGRLYPNLDELVSKGLVEKGQKDRRTNSYRLTARGERELSARHSWEAEYVSV